MSFKIACAPVSCVVVKNSGSVSSGHADDHVGAVHGVEFTTRGVASDTTTLSSGLWCNLGFFLGLRVS